MSITPVPSETFDLTLHNVLRTHLSSIERDQPVPMDISLVELGLDSLAAVNLVLDLEDTFQIEFPDTLLNEATFQTGASLRDALLLLKPAATEPS